MKIATLLMAAAIPALAQQSFDFSSLDKLAAGAKESTTISLEGDTLKAATSMLGPEMTETMKNLKAVHVRSFEYAKEKQYRPADLAPVRAWVASLKWSKIVDVKEESETDEIYFQPGANGGIAIITAEPTEVNVIVIQGSVTLDDISKLKNLGVPSAVVNHGGGKSDDSKKD